MTDPTVGFFAVADEFEINQSLMAVDGVNQTVIAGESYGETARAALELLAFIGVGKHAAYCREGLFTDFGAERGEILFERAGVARACPVSPSFAPS
jgi:hypothetical protein